MSTIAFVRHTILTISMLFLLLVVSAWAFVKACKAYIKNGEVEEDEESCMFKSLDWESKYFQTALFFTEKATFSSTSSCIEPLLPPLNPGATHSHPSLPPISQDSDASLIHFDGCLSSQGASPVNPTAENSEKYVLRPDDLILGEVVLRPKVCTAPIIILTPPPKEKREKSTKAPLLPRQTLTPDYYRRVRKTTTLAPPPVVSKRKRSREQQLREYIPPAYLLAQRCIDIVHSRSARHAAADEMRYGGPQKF